jgi:hypothetical protein
LVDYYDIYVPMELPCFLLLESAATRLGSSLSWRALRNSVLGYMSCAVIPAPSATRFVIDSSTSVCQGMLNMPAIFVGLELHHLAPDRRHGHFNLMKARSALLKHARNAGSSGKRRWSCDVACQTCTAGVFFCACYIRSNPT